MKDFDKIFGDRLRGYGSEVPGSVWKGIEQRRRKKRRRLLFWLWGGGAAGALALLLAAWGGAFHFSDSEALANQTADHVTIAPAQPREQPLPTPAQSDLNSVFSEENPAAQLKEKTVEKPAALNFQPAAKLAEGAPTHSAEPALVNGLTTAQAPVNQELRQNVQATTTTLDGPSEPDNQEGEITEKPQLERLPALWLPIKQLRSDVPAFEIPEAEYLPQKQSRSTFHFDGFVGASIHRQLLSARGSGFETYEGLRDRTEQERISYTAGLRFSAVKPSGLAFRTGLTYTLINDRFHWDEAPVTQLLVSNDSILGSQTGRWIKTTYNRYHFIEVPLLLGFEKQAGKLDLSFSAGPMVNLWFRQRGDFMSPGNRPARFTEGEPGRYPAFRSWAGLSLFASSSLNLELKEKLTLLLEPYLRYQLTNLTLDEYPLQKRYLSGGLMLGLRKSF